MLQNSQKWLLGITLFLALVICLEIGGYLFLLHKERQLQNKRISQIENVLIEAESDPVGAIAKLKEITPTNGYTPAENALAVEMMGELFYKFVDEKITRAIFSGAVYEDFYKEGNVDLAYRRLYEYSLQISPRPLPAYEVAKWYAIASLNEPEGSQEKAQHQALTEGYLEQGDALLENRKISSNEKIKTGIVRAIAVGNLSVGGDAAFGGEEVFKGAYNASLGTEFEGRARYEYALFLATFFLEERREDILKLLEPIFISPQKFSEGALHLKSDMNLEVWHKLAEENPIFREFLQK